MFELKKYTAPDFTKEMFKNAPDAKFVRAEKDGIVPPNFHAMSIFPEYFRVEGKWMLAEESRMDCVPVLEGNNIAVVEPRSIKAGDLICTGRTECCEEGIFIHADGFESEENKNEVFSFRNGNSRETSFSKDYDELYELLKYEKEHGNIVWVLGPAVAFDHDSRKAMCSLIENGFVNTLMAGNALATHDLEASYLGTALGQDIYTKKHAAGGHYHHLETINKVREYGSVAEFIKQERIEGSIIASCEKMNVPYVLAGSIRDDGPLPPVFGNVYDAQDAMRNRIRKATTVICMATALHTIATGNMTPSFRVMPDGTIRQTYFYCVDISEFTTRKLADRGSLTSRGIVTNVQDFVVNLERALVK